MKKRSKLFSHFVAILHALALAIPLIAFAVVSLQDALPKWFSSQAVQHHGGTNDEFSDDLDYSLDNLQTRTMNQNLFHTLDELNYLNYESSTGQVYKKIEYQTNEVNSVDDLIVGNIYLFSTYNSDEDMWGNLISSDYFDEITILNFKIVNYDDLQFYDWDFADDYFTYFNRMSIYPNLTDTSPIINLYSNNYTFINFNFDQYANIEFTILLDTNFKSFITNEVNNDILTFFDIADLTQLPPRFELISEGGDISTFDEYMEFYQNSNFSTIVSEGTKNNFIFNFDFISLFNQGVVNNGDSIASLLFINFYLNYIINISLIIFLPEVIMVFFDICRKFVYKFTDMGDKY